MSLPSPLPTLQSLASSLGDLRTHLHPLLKQSFEDVISKLEQGSSVNNDQEQSPSPLQGRLDSAKLQVSLAYVLLDLVWINQKLTGQDPAQHRVHEDLSRVRSYFAKIKSVENHEASATSASHNENPTMPDQHQRLRVDQAAAGRFIKSAIGSEKGKHTKFEHSDAEEKEDGKEASATTQSKNGRSVKDPFEGYGDATTQKKKKRKASASVPVVDAPAETPSPKLKKKKSQKKLKAGE